jgi:2-polyprenyl-3-methyl-5-hydroxy-6-metoxy-1,4-benzoquinol methylase
MEPASDPVHTYKQKPPGETEFQLKEESSYHREIFLCNTCGHFHSYHNMNIESIYESNYVDSTYGGWDGILRNYERIMAFDPKNSDNSGRVNRVIKFAQDHFSDRTSALRILDIGSGLGVFLGKIIQFTDWQCAAIETDPRFALHMSENLGIETITSDYLNLNWDREFDIITLNKVLEHVERPSEMLKKCLSNLAPNGFIYLELPDGESAASDEEGFQREEFFIEHFHVFSMASMALLNRGTGLQFQKLERLRETSSKYTLRSFLVHAN